MNTLIEKRLKWLIDNRRMMFIGVGVAFVCALIAFRSLERKKGSALNQFIHADHLFSQWKTYPADQKQHLDQLKEMIKKFPQLHAKYVPLVAQSLLSHQEILDSSLIGKLLKRVEIDSPYSSQFSKTSLLLSQKEYGAALEQSIHLKQDFDRTEAQEKLEVLYLFNQLRIALLQKEAGSAREEFLAWKEFEKCAGWDNELELSPSRKRALSLLVANFQEKNISLRDYIKYRKSLLAMS